MREDWTSLNKRETNLSLQAASLPLVHLVRKRKTRKSLSVIQSKAHLRLKPCLSLAWSQLETFRCNIRKVKRAKSPTKKLRELSIQRFWLANQDKMNDHKIKNHSAGNQMWKLVINRPKQAFYSTQELWLVGAYTLWLLEPRSMTGIWRELPRSRDRGLPLTWTFSECLQLSSKARR